MIIPPNTPAFAIWHQIANATNPLLVIALIVGLVLLWRRDKKYFWRLLSATLISIVLLNLVRFGEAHFEIWSHWGMNFSTHAAMTIALCLPLAFLWPKRWWIFLAIFILYDALMMMLRFHSLPDILTTSLVIFPLCWLCQFAAWRNGLKATSPAIP